MSNCLFTHNLFFNFRTSCILKDHHHNLQEDRGAHKIISYIPILVCVLLRQARDRRLRWQKYFRKCCIRLNLNPYFWKVYFSAVQVIWKKMLSFDRQIEVWIEDQNQTCFNWLSSYLVGYGFIWKNLDPLTKETSTKLALKTTNMS